MSAMLLHIEAGKCISGIESQHVNSLAVQCSTAEAYTSKEHEPWLRAGAPPSSVRSAYKDNKRNAWRCPVCKQFFLSEADIMRHYEDKSCTNDYPYTLKCTECSELFTRLSTLYAHCESTACGGKAQCGPLARLRVYLKSQLRNPAQMQALTQIAYQLRFDTSSKPAVVNVKVVRNALPTANGVAVNGVGV